MTVKNKRRGQILQVEANECRTLIAFSNAVKPYFDTINNNNVNGVLETFEKQIVTELPNVKVKGYSRSMAGVELVTMFSRSLPVMKGLMLQFMKLVKLVLLILSVEQRQSRYHLLKDIHLMLKMQSMMK